jgi:hypothetical protein
MVVSDALRISVGGLSLGDGVAMMILGTLGSSAEDIRTGFNTLGRVAGD